VAAADAQGISRYQALQVQGHAAAKETLPENVTKNTFLPFHPGAVRYFEEKGFKIPPELRG